MVAQLAGPRFSDRFFAVWVSSSTAKERDTDAPGGSEVQDL